MSTTSESLDFFFKVSGVVFGVSTLTTFYYFAKFRLINEARVVHISEVKHIINDKETICIEGIVVKDNSQSHPSRFHPVEYPELVYSNYTDSRYNQLGFKIRELSEPIKVSSTQQRFLLVQDDSLVLIQPEDSTEIHANQIYSEFGYFQLSLGQVIKNIASTVLILFTRFFGVYVEISQQITEEVIPVNASITALGTLRQYSKLPSLIPSHIALSKTQLLVAAKRTFHISLAVQLVAGTLCACLGTVIYLRRREVDSLKEWYERQRVLMPENYTCAICCDNPRDVIFHPCNHVCVCQVCNQDVESCPICRQEIEKRIIIVLS